MYAYGFSSPVIIIRNAPNKGWSVSRLLQNHVVAIGVGFGFVEHLDVAREGYHIYPAENQYSRYKLLRSKHVFAY